jgi:hypothetical protein
MMIVLSNLCLMITGGRCEHNRFRDCDAKLWSSPGVDHAKFVVNRNRQVAKGFKDDYYHPDADVVVLAGETHLYRKNRKPVSNPSHSHVTDTQPNIPF